jgi:ribosomal protein S18 acetylase RimI-like enzyme
MHKDILIRTIEELSMNAWPALHTVFYDGWILRFAGGYTRRANSVAPLYPSSRDSAEKLPVCEALFRETQLPTVFKLAATSQAGALDWLLAEHGYRSEALTSVQVLDLNKWTGDQPEGVESSGAVTEEWLAAASRMSRARPEQIAAHRKILALIVPARHFAWIEAEGQVIACGLGVAQDGYVGIFDIAVDPGRRRQGYAERLMQDLLAWGKQVGARTAYLQVMLDNEPALHLYQKLGFREAYQYWYRVKPY